METVNKQLIEKWFKDLQRIIFDVKVTVDNLNRLINSKSSFEKQVLKHGFFKQFYRQSWFTTVVQLSKLFSDNKSQKRNLFKFFNILEDFKYDEDFLEELKQNKNKFGNNLYFSKQDVVNSTKELRKEIESKQEIIDKIIFLRDKIYAHSDIDPELPQINVQELTELSELSINIYNTLRGGMLDISFLFDVNSEWSIDYLIKSLAKQRQEFEEKFKAMRK